MSETARSKAREEAVWPREGGRYGTAFDEGWDAALEWAAGQVESKGCICLALNGGEEYNRGFSGPPDFTFEGKMDFRLADPVVEHDPRCPVSLAAQIREGCLERGERGMYGEHAP